MAAVRAVWWLLAGLLRPNVRRWQCRLVGVVRPFPSWGHLPTNYSDPRSCSWCGAVL